MKLGFVVPEQFLHPVSGFGHEPLDLLVDPVGGCFAVIRLVGDIPAQEDLVLLLAQGRSPDFLAHPPVAYHVAADPGDLLDIALRAGGDFPEDDLLGRAASKRRGHRTQAVRAGLQVALLRQGNSHAQTAALRQDRHLVQWVDFFDEFEGEGMAGLVVGHDFPLLVADHEMPLRSHHHLLFRLFEILVRHGGVVVPRGDQGGFVHHVSQIRPDHSGHALGQHVELDRVVERDFAALHVDLKDLFPTYHVGPVDDDMAVEAAGTEQGGIEHVRPVGRADHDDGIRLLEAVQPHQQLVQGLFPLVVSAAEAGAAVTADGVDFIDEDDARGVLPGLVEEIADAGGADPHEHLDEVRSAHAEEGHARLSGHGLGQQGLAGTRGSQQQRAFRYASAQGVELVRILQEFHDFLQVALGFEHPRHVGEGDGRPVFDDHLGPALAEGEHAALSRLHLSQNENPEPDQQQPGQGGDEVADPVGGLRLGRHHDVPGHEIGYEVRIVKGDVYLEVTQALVRALDHRRRILAEPAGYQFLGDGDLLDIVGFEKLLELRIGNRYRAIAPLGKELRGHQEEKEEHEPDKDRAVLLRLVRLWLSFVSGWGLLPFVGRLGHSSGRPRFVRRVGFRTRSRSARLR